MVEPLPGRLRSFPSKAQKTTGTDKPAKMTVRVQQACPTDADTHMAAAAAARRRSITLVLLLITFITVHATAFIANTYISRTVYTGKSPQYHAKAYEKLALAIYVCELIGGNKILVITFRHTVLLYLTWNIQRKLFVVRCPCGIAQVKNVPLWYHTTILRSTSAYTSSAVPVQITAVDHVAKKRGRRHCRMTTGTLYLSCCPVYKYRFYDTYDITRLSAVANVSC